MDAQTPDGNSAVPAIPHVDATDHAIAADTATQRLEQPVSAPATDAPTQEVEFAAQPTHPPVVTANSDPAPTIAATHATPTPLSGINAARRPPTLSTRGSGLNISQDIQARMKAFHLGRQGAPPRTMSSPRDAGSPNSALSPTPGGSLAGGVPAGFRLPNGKPGMSPTNSSPAVPGRLPQKKPSMAERRGMALPGGLPGATPVNGAPAGRKKPGLTLSQMNPGPAGSAPGDETKPTGGTMMDKYADFIDAKTGTLMFKGKATLSSQGVEFASGSSFSISLDEVDTMDELGKGNYGTVYKVRHARPRVRRPGMGLAGNKASHGRPSDSSPDDASPASTVSSLRQSGTSGAVMAMKEIRLELDDAKFAAIIMELDILHRCLSAYIVDFYGAFFQEGAVYICMEFMNGGSIDKIYGDGIPEGVLRKIAYATTMGLKVLKEDHNIIHRDVKPTNILINSRGQIKICDFGVSGNLVASIAKTNIGCQSYMAPERISSGGVAMTGAPGGTYSVQSDIWSLGLTIIECALGRYPYPPETYNNIFSQLSAIVDGDPPDLPATGFSEAAHNFVSGCLNKIPNLRPTYPMLLQHAWLAPLHQPGVIAEEDEEAAEAEAAAPTSVAASTESIATSEDALGTSTDDFVDREVGEWVLQALERKRAGKMAKADKPALHAAPMDEVDAVATPGSLKNVVAAADEGKEPVAVPAEA